MDLRRQTKRIDARFANILDVLLSPPGWLAPFAQIAATQTEDRLAGGVAPASGEHNVHFALGHPEVVLEDVAVRFPFTWWLEGYTLLPQLVVGALTVAPLPDGSTGITFEVNEGRPGAGAAAEAAVSLLIDLVASALLGLSEVKA